MPRLGPIKRVELIRYLQILGFEGPYSGGKHQFMLKGTIRLRLPNPHRRDVGRELLSRILKQAGIDKDSWEKL
ncbi:MAG: type II toxin-antitoxin system HicA family toxin [Chloroflexota bacterium]|nr:type II toxin-antitoxin system HicA family toxin [Chloroflexota bacterium]